MNEATRITLAQMRSRPKTVPVEELPGWLRRYADAYYAEIDPDPTTVADYLTRSAEEIERLLSALKTSNRP